jgi:arylsulfatase A-like enzyme
MIIGMAQYYLLNTFTSVVNGTAASVKLVGTIAKNILCFTSVLVFMGARCTSQTQQPNIIIIYTDDVGYGDLSCYGATSVKTPNIDRLAQDGLRFTRAYACASTCTPSRYALLTGEYHWRKPPGWRIGNLEGVSIAPGDAGLIIDTAKATLPAVLKNAGYSTAVIGKWHLGLGPVGGPEWNIEIKPGPRDIGFDYSFIIPATGDRVPCVYVENGLVAGIDPNDPIQVSFNAPIGADSTIYNPNVTPGEIVSYDKPPEMMSIENDTSNIKMHPSFGHDQTIVNGIPRIGYMTGGYSARWKDEDIADVITGKALSYITENKDKPFFLYFSTHDIHVPRVPNERFSGKSEVGVYGDVLIQMDWCAGEIIKKLDEFDLTDNTLVIFTSDNGPVQNDGYFDGTGEDLDSHTPRGPFKGGKYSAFEGGTRIPFIVRWPGKIKPGISKALFSQIDLLSTLAALTGHKNPDQLSLDSRNHLSVLLGEGFSGREYVVGQNMGGTLSIIKGNWKYIEPGDGPQYNPYTLPAIELGNSPKPCLFDISHDVTEENNLAGEFPEITGELAEILKHLKNIKE